MNTHGLPIVLASENDPRDRLLLQEAFEGSSVRVDLRLVVDGMEFLDYLHQRSPWKTSERPDLILLDLNMPRMNGLDALREIKTHPTLRTIPVVVLTTSSAPEDITACYAEGANTYVRKPQSFTDLANVIRVLCQFWFELGVVPGTAER